jgi:drug/metabolite transporter (DMT)-like permease
MDPGLMNRARLGVAVIVTFAIACGAEWIWPWELISSTPLTSWLWLGLSGLVGLAIGDLFGFTSLRILGARRQSVIGTTAPAASAIVGLVLLGEALTLADVVGIALTILGVMVAMNTPDEREDVHSEGFGSYSLGILLAIGGAVCQGAGLVLAKKGMQGQGVDIAPFHATFLRMIIGFSATYLIDVIRRAPHRPLREAFTNREARTAMFFGTFFGPIVGVTMSLVAAKNLDVAVAQTIFSLVPFVVMLIMRVFYGQRIPARSLFGAVISVIGVVILVVGMP